MQCSCQVIDSSLAPSVPVFLQVPSSSTVYLKVNSSEFTLSQNYASEAGYSIYSSVMGMSGRGGYGGQKTPLPESYRESLKSGVVV